MEGLKDMNEADKAMKVQEIVADRNNMVKEVLTPEQKEKFQALMQEKASEEVPVMEQPMEEETK
jgi:Spy/CpxP family protein refolding chaperone